MLDFVAVAMVGVSIVLLFSIYLVRYRKMYQVHKRIQICLAAILAIAIVAFEIDIRFFVDWRKLAEPSPYYQSGTVDTLLMVHLCFAIPTPFFWAFTIFQAIKKMGPNFENAGYRQTHRRLGWMGTLLMLMTSATGWLFYWAGFVAK